MRVSDTNAAAAGCTGVSQRRQEWPFFIRYTHDQQVEINPSDDRSSDTARNMARCMGPVSAWSSCWPWQGEEMRAGVTHSFMRYHGNGRREDRVSERVCVCMYVCTWEFPRENRERWRATMALKCVWEGFEFLLERPIHLKLMRFIDKILLFHGNNQVLSWLQVSTDHWRSINSCACWHLFWSSPTLAMQQHVDNLITLSIPPFISRLLRNRLAELRRSCHL